MNARSHWLAGFVLALALTPVAALLVLAAPRARQDFPHEKHVGLFPLCAGCHEGVESGIVAEVFPDSASCSSCHDGAPLARVTFTLPRAEPSNLRFDHLVHVRAVASAEVEAPTCASCHATPDAPRMTVDPLAAERCLNCHTPPRAEHLVAAECSVCHVPLAASGFPRERIAELELPSDHESGRFLRELHGQLAVEEAGRCATCHTRERCVACHVDAGRPEIGAIPAAPAGMRLPDATAAYPLPPSHQTPRFRTEHGALAQVEGGARCATCHTRDDCASCHLPPLPAAAAALAARAAVVAPGVGLAVNAPESHRTPRFDRTHGTLAASEVQTCASCHTQPFCSNCHNAAQRPVYHETNFVARHAADGWGRTTECASCHETQVFCRNCHVQSGFGARGRLGRGFHDAEPLWLLRHGQAARQSLETCASCHAQRNCLQCHSQVGAFKVNPHGPGFDARRAWARSPGICLACHVGSPFSGPPEL